eukprot:SAG31_NODE_210_length_20286_cov_22.684748_18_plen_173_part_00
MKPCIVNERQGAPPSARTPEMHGIYVYDTSGALHWQIGQIYGYLGIYIYPETAAVLEAAERRASVGLPASASDQELEAAERRAAEVQAAHEAQLAQVRAEGQRSQFQDILRGLRNPAVPDPESEPEAQPTEAQPEPEPEPEPEAQPTGEDLGFSGAMPPDCRVLPSVGPESE